MVRRLIMGLAWVAVAVGCDKPARPEPQAAAVPRLVSLTPSASELAAAVGATANLIAVDTYSTFPPEVAGLPKVGNFLAPDLEGIMRLRPTLVLADDVHADVAAALGDAGIPTLSLPMHGLADVRRSLRTLGDRLGPPYSDAADAAIARVDAAVAAAEHANRDRPRPRVLGVIDHEAGGIGNLVAAGPGSWLAELISLAGGTSVLTDAPVRYPKLAAEDIVQLAPEVILDVAFAADVARPTLGFSDLPIPAAKTARIHVAKAAFLAAPSPRVEEALAAVTPLLHSVAPPSPPPPR